jgi:hypothetical protein
MHTKHCSPYFAVATPHHAHCKLQHKPIFPVRERKKKRKAKKAKNSIFFFCTGVASSPADEVARALVTACTTSRTVTAQHAAAHAICAASTVVRVAALRLLAGASKASLAPRQARALVVALAAALRCGFDGVDAIGNVVSDAVAALQALVPPLAARAVHTALHVGAVSRHGQAAWRLVVRKLIAAGNDTVLGALLANAEIRLAVMRPLAGGADDLVVRGELWQLFVTKLAAVRTRDERAVLLARFAPIFAHASVDELNAVVMPAVEKQTRRAPELSLGVLAFILRHLPRALDVGAPVRAAALQQALPEVRAKRDLCLADATDLVHALARYAAPVDGAEFGTVLAAVTEPIATEKDTTARLGLIGAVRVLAPLASELKSADVQRTLATGTVAALSAAAESESNDRVRAALLEALAAWAPLAQSIVPAHAKLLAKLLKLSGPPAGRALDGALLRTALAALSARQATPAAVEHVDDKLRTLLRDAAVGPSGFTLGGAPPSLSVVVTDGILALAVVARVAFHTSNVGAMPATPLLYSLGTNVPADRATAEAVVAVVESGAVVTASQAANPMARCLLSSEGVARRFALESLGRVVAAVPASAGATVAALRKLFDATAPTDVTWSPHRGARRMHCDRVGVGAHRRRAGRHCRQRAAAAREPPRGAHRRVAARRARTALAAACHRHRALVARHDAPARRRHRPRAAHHDAAHRRRRRRE